MKQRILPALWLSLMLVTSLSVPAWCGQMEIIDHRTAEEGLFDNTVSAVSAAGDTGVFIASAGGLHILSDYYFLPIFQKIPAVALSQDPAGDLWAATAAGFIYRITDRDGLWTASRFAVDPGTKIAAIAGRFGVVTIGTDSGLYYAGPDGTLHTIVKETGFSALTVAGDGTIIAGARDRAHKKGGLLIIGGAFATKTGWVSELSGRDVRALFVDRDRLLIGTDTDGAIILDSAGLHAVALPEKPGRITAFLVYDETTVIASDTGLYTSTKGGAFEFFSAEDNAPTGITSLAPAPGSAVWVGTENNGIYLVRFRQ